MRDAHDFNNMETRAVIKFVFLQGKAPKEIHAILTETLACFLPGRAKTYQHSCIMNTAQPATYPTANRSKYSEREDQDQVELHLNTQSVQCSKHTPSWLYKTSQLMLYRKIIAVYSQIHTKHINAVCGQNEELLNVKLVVHIVTTGL